MGGEPSARDYVGLQYILAKGHKQETLFTIAFFTGMHEGALLALYRYVLGSYKKILRNADYHQIRVI